MEGAIYKLVGWVAGALTMWLAFVVGAMTERSASGSPMPRYIGAVAVAGFLAVGLSAGLGTHVEDADPILGGGTRVYDYTPTDRERSEHRWLLFLALAISSCAGIHNGAQARGSGRD